MANVFDVDSAELIKRMAAKLEAAKIEKPAYVDFVKSGAGKERAPSQKDFWYTRCASVLRHVYINGPIGVSRLRKMYSSRKRHVVHRHHHYPAGGSIISDSLHALEKLGYIKSTKQGRVLTPQGKSFVDKSCNEVMGA